MRKIHESNKIAASWKRESPLERFENEGPMKNYRKQRHMKNTLTGAKKKKKITPTRVREIGGSRKARVAARRGRRSASIMRNRAFCRDKQKGETEADRALIASTIDARDRFNLRRLSTCVWMSARRLTSVCVCAPFRTSMFIEQESGI